MWKLWQYINKINKIHRSIKAILFFISVFPPLFLFLLTYLKNIIPVEIIQEMLSSAIQFIWSIVFIVCGFLVISVTLYFSFYLLLFIKNRQSIFYYNKIKKINTIWQYLRLDEKNYPRVTLDIQKQFIHLYVRKNLAITLEDIEKIKPFLEEIFELSITNIKSSYAVIEITFLRYQDIINRNDFIQKFQKNKILYGLYGGNFYFWDFNKHPHALIVAPAGSGKTHLLRMILDQVVKIGDVIIFDGKKIEFIDYAQDYKVIHDNFLEELKKYHNQMMKRYEIMRSKQVKNYYETDLKAVFLVCDEFTSIVENIRDKKDKDLFQALYFDVVRLGRSAGFFGIQNMQRADVKFLSGEARNNFGFKVVLGSADDETYRMMFSTADIEKLDVGQGYALQGTTLSRFAFPVWD